MRTHMLLVLILAVSMPLAVIAAEEANSVAKPEKASAATDNAKQEKPAEKKLTGRLPAYYGPIVTEEQRQEIYRIQAKHNVTIDALKTALRKAVEKRNAEVEAVLTEKQREELIAKTTKAREERRREALERLKKRDGSKQEPAKRSTPTAE